MMPKCTMDIFYLIGRRVEAAAFVGENLWLSTHAFRKGRK